MEDPTVRRLTKKVFPYLWVRHKLMSSVPSTGIFPFSEITVFSQGIGNAVVVYLHMYRPTLSSYLNKHIPSMPQSKVYFWTHVAFLCLQIRLTNDNVFDYFLTTCAITAEVALHCYINGYDDVLSLASVFFNAFFENELYNGFHEAGGWDGLQQYIETNSCAELFELVNCYLKKLSSPSEHFPILISIKREQLAAERRKKLISLSSLKIGENEREDQAKKLVSGIFHWHFMENRRVLEVKPGILKRMENVRRRNESSEADEIMDADNKISNVKPQCLHDEAQTSKSVTTISETIFSNKAVQTDDSKCMKVKKEVNNQRCTNNETPEETKSSSSLSELRNFYESLSTSAERKVDDSKYFRSNSGTRNGLKSSVFQDLVNRHEKVNHFERYPKSAPPSSEKGRTFPKPKNFTPETEIKSVESFHTDDAQSELTKSFEDLGFKCLCASNSSQLDEKSAFENHAEIMERCRYFQNKYSSVQFVILIPNNYFTDETAHAPETEKCDEILFENKVKDQQFSSITKDDFKNFTSSTQRPRSETEITRFVVPEVDKNQFGLANGLALSQNSAIENIHKSRFVVTKVEDNDFPPIPKTSKISRFSVTKVNENQILLRDETSLLDKKCATESTTVSRFRVTRVNENYSMETTKISRFTVTKVNESYSMETTKKSRFTVTKVNEIHSTETKISRFSITKVNENQLNNGTSILGKNWTNEMNNLSKFTVEKVNENQSKKGTGILRKHWKNGTAKISRFTVTKVTKNEPNDVVSILKKNWKNEATKSSRFSVRKVDESQHMSGAGMGIFRKSHPTNTTKKSRFTVTLVDENQRSLNRNDSISSEMSSDAENETVHLQDNGSVKYQKRVSFADHAIIYFPTLSSDESSNSITSRESLNLDSQSLSNFGHNANQDTLTTPVLRSPTVSESLESFQHSSSGENQSTSNSAESSNTKSGSRIGQMFSRLSFRSSKKAESPTENKEKMDE